MKKEPKKHQDYWYIEHMIPIFGVWSATEYDRERIKKYGWFKSKEQAVKFIQKLESKGKTPLTSKKLYLVGFPRHPWVYGTDNSAGKGLSAYMNCFTSLKEAESYLLTHMQSEGRKCNIYELKIVKSLVA